MFPTMPFNRKRYWITAPGLGEATPPASLEAPAPAPEAPREPSGGAVEGGTHLRYEHPVWEPEPLGTADLPVRVVLIASADAAVTAALVEQLGARGIRHIVAPSGRGGPDRIEELAGRGELPDAVVHLAAGHLDWSAPATDVDDAFRTVFGLAVDVLSRGARVPLRLLCARVGGDGREQPHLVAMAGLLRTLGQERSCTGVCVALEPESPAVLATRLVGELCGGRDVEVAYRDGVRVARRMARFEPPPAATGWVSADGAYVITGGAGALGLHFAGLLAERGAGEVLLVGRSELDAATAARVATLGRGSRRVRYERADVARSADVERLVGQVRDGGRPLRGIIHAAGVIRDAPALAKTHAQITEVFAPKIAGTLNLDRATVGEPLDFFVLFSSVVGQTGNRGQADYAYANAFLDAFAETRERWRMQGRRRGKSLAIGWPLWREGGMRVDDATAERLRRRWGMVPMSTRSGLAAFEALLAGFRPAVLVVETLVEDGPDIPPSSALPPPLVAAPSAATSLPPTGPAAPAGPALAGCPSVLEGL